MDFSLPFPLASVCPSFPIWSLLFFDNQGERHHPLTELFFTCHLPVLRYRIWAMGKPGASVLLWNISETIFFFFFFFFFVLVLNSFLTSIHLDAETSWWYSLKFLLFFGIFFLLQYTFSHWNPLEVPFRDICNF